MFDRLPWGISCAACTILAFTSSDKANSYQASVNTDLYQQSGDLQMVWMKPQDGILGGGISLLAIFGGAFSLYKMLNVSEVSTDKSPETSVGATPQQPAQQDTPKTQTSTQTQADQFQASQPIQPSQSAELTQSVESASSLVTPTVQAPTLFDRVWNHRKRHLLIPAETGAGKTTFLLGLIKYCWQQSGQTVEIYGSTTKPSPWMGLEDELAPDGLPRIINLDITKPRQIEKLIQRLRWIQRRMQQRQMVRAEAEATGKSYAPNRIILIPDEWNSTLALAKRFDKLLQRELAEAKATAKGNRDATLPQAPYAEDELKALMESILLMGREDECAEWVFGQDHQVQNAGFNTGYQKNFGIVVPFRKGAMQALEQALIGRSPVLPMATGKQMLQQAYDTIAGNPDTTFVYSNLNGHEILEMPHLPNIKREKLYGRQQPATATATAETTVESESTDPWEE